MNIRSILISLLLANQAADFANTDDTGNGDSLMSGKFVKDTSA